ncbi:MAG: methyltransferase domain-containing protein [bacterium]|nr:methyltransferase domain-containing protein [bacterium]
MVRREHNLPNDLICIDLGCGIRKQKGYIGVDGIKLEGVDVVCDIEKSLPFKDSTIDRIYANFLFEHITNFIPFMQELYRICKNGATILASFPYWSSVTQWKDPTHKQVITVETFKYFSTDKWYGSDYRINTNFKVNSVKYNYLPPFNNWRCFFLFPFRKFLSRHLINIVHSVWIELDVIK